jgi:hypothetical protein
VHVAEASVTRQAHHLVCGLQSHLQHRHIQRARHRCVAAVNSNAGLTTSCACLHARAESDRARLRQLGHRHRGSAPLSQKPLSPILQCTGAATPCTALPDNPPSCGRSHSCSSPHSQHRRSRGSRDTTSRCWPLQHHSPRRGGSSGTWRCKRTGAVSAGFVRILKKSSCMVHGRISQCKSMGMPAAGSALGLRAQAGTGAAQGLV